MLLTDDDGTIELPAAELAATVAAREREPGEPPRWVWSDTAARYPELLAAGARVERCHDLRLVDAILAGVDGRAPEPALARTVEFVRPPMPRPQVEALFEFDDVVFDGSSAPVPAVRPGGPDLGRPAPVPTLAATQRADLARDRGPGAPRPRALALLAAAESAGALAAVEMQSTGLPWSAETHDALLTELLGPRPEAPGARPASLTALGAEVERLLGAAPGSIPLDSPPELVKALRRAGLEVSSARSWELRRLDHPAIEPLLRYKKLSRLLSANGWNWLDAHVRDGRFRPSYVPGAVVTGRWGSDGGGALQLPKQIRGAVQADPGWVLVVADAAQLEPRILAALSHDAAMARAGAGEDLYAGIVASGAVESREQAKLGMLGAMYGGTTGQSARVLPRLQRAFPDAIRFVEEAARAGERGEHVRTRLGRTSPAPSEAWRERQLIAASDAATAAQRDEARSAARAWGRFTRNFVVQGSAAEWALSWMAGVRRRLWSPEGGPLASQPHLVFFLHDELIVHAPRERAPEVEQVMRAAAVDAGRLLFQGSPVSFPVTVATVERYSDAK
ncbi:MULTISPECIES: bifunctional 3'-5' exonuclease/DNA polymerase [unclassified Microcella]|uniref:bifunctional 3'-5' exonuclease/DNA polymerase n=1 Tax=unclassified Microcella TaxID=2630066 RepID=UPI0009E7FEC2